MRAKRIVGLGICGVVVGALLAVVAPPRELFAACVCNDSGTGAYQCNADQTGCKAGSEECHLDCAS